MAVHVERKNRLTGQNLGPASGGAQFLADADDVLLKAIGSAASGVNNLPDPYGALMDAAPGNRWDPTLGAGGPGLDQLQRAVQGGLDTGGGALETADRAIMRGGGAAGRGVADFATKAAGAPQHNLTAIRNLLQRYEMPGVRDLLDRGEEPQVRDLLDRGEEYVQRPMQQYETGARGVVDPLGVVEGLGRGIADGVGWLGRGAEAASRGVADFATKAANQMGNNLRAIPGGGGIASGASAAARGVADFVTGGVDQAGNNLRGLANLLGADFSDEGGPPTDGVRAADPNRSRPLDDRTAVLQELYSALEREQQAALINQLFPTFEGGNAEGGNAMGLAEQLAGEDRGYSQDRYGDLKTYLGSQRERAGGQFDSDEEAILGQLRQQDQERRDTEGLYETKRKAEFGETERKLDARTSAASARLNNLGINPTKYTELVGVEMGALLGAQMQSGSDLAHRMAMLGAERARLGQGRAKSGFAKERRQFDADASDMLFQGSQRLSYELQDIDRALMNRRITAEDAKSQAAAAAHEAQMQAQRAMQLGISIGMDPVAAAATSSIPGSMNKFIEAAGAKGRTITLGPGMLPSPAFDGFIGEEITLDDYLDILKGEKLKSETAY